MDISVSRWTKSSAVISHPSGHDGAIPLAQSRPFCSRNNISRKSKKVNESFLLQNIFRDSKNIFCDFFVEMELEQTRKLKH